MQRKLLIACVWAASLLMGGQSAVLAQPEPEISFERDIRPILQQHCIECHGPGQTRGGLRLDSREAAERGGDTQLPILGGTLEDNELYLRVRSADPTYRMPKGTDALDERELGLLKDWVNAGTPWPAAPVVVPAAPTLTWFDQLIVWVVAFEDWKDGVPGFTPLLIAALVILLGILVLEKLKQRFSESVGGAAVHPQGAWWTRIGAAEYVICVLCWIGTVGYLQYSSLVDDTRSKLSERESELTSVKSKLAMLTGVGPGFYGDPPRPRRPRHGKGLAQQYYRGNCERNKNLFNNGNYRTAVLSVSLIDETGRQLEYGESVAGRSLAVQFELERSPGTAAALYSSRLMSSVFLSEQVPSQKEGADGPVIIGLSEVKQDWKWKAVVPLPGTGDGGSGKGLVYVYKGRVSNGKVQGTPHYGISYRVDVKDGVLQRSSEVWLGNLFTPPVVSPPPPPVSASKVPFDEWFSVEPLPEITGANATDPVLLGIPEHVKEPAADESRQ